MSIYIINVLEGLDFLVRKRFVQEDEAVGVLGVRGVGVAGVDLTEVLGEQTDVLERAVAEVLADVLLGERCILVLRRHLDLAQLHEVETDD